MYESCYNFLRERYVDATKDQSLLDAMDLSPEIFRDHLIVDAAGQRTAPLGRIMDDWQRKDFEAVDPCLMWLAGREFNGPVDEDGFPAIRRFFMQRARGHSKTSDMATSITWLLHSGLHFVDGYSFAEDKEQAKLLRKQMFKLQAHNPWLRERLEYQRNTIFNKRTSAQIQICSSDVMSSWGITPDFVIADEFSHWTKSDLWGQVFSSFSKKEGMLICALNAGFGYGWQYNVKKHAMEADNWHHSAPEGCVASWISEKVLNENRAVLPESEFQRIWLNHWQESSSQFVTIDEAEACCDETLVKQSETKHAGWPYIAAVDFAPKNDRTVGVVMHLEGKTVLVDTMDVICPQARGKTTDTLWVMQWMEAVQERFGRVYFVIDPYQLMTINEILSNKGLHIEQFDFASGNGNWELSVCLQQMILGQRVKWYPGCGQICDSTGKVMETRMERDDLEMELATLLVQPYSNGRKWRIQHHNDQIHHDDRAFALGAGLLYIVKNTGGFGEWGMIPPDRSGNWDFNALRVAA